MKTKFILFMMLLCFATVVNAQTLGTKKVIVMKLSSFGCGDDACALDFIDEKTSYVLSGIELVPIDLASISLIRPQGFEDISVDEY